MIPSPRDEFLKSIISAPSVGQEVLRVAMVPKIDVSHGYKNESLYTKSFVHEH